ncbi:MAG: hypothetical protein QXU99_03435 [Candidatus Bathyarchaeia archaeon]
MKFTKTHVTGNFNWADPAFSISNEVLHVLYSMPSIAVVDTRLVLRDYVQKVSNFTVDPETLATIPIGDNRV